MLTTRPLMWALQVSRIPACLVTCITWQNIKKKETRTITSMTKDTIFGLLMVTWMKVLKFLFKGGGGGCVKFFRKIRRGVIVSCRGSTGKNSTTHFTALAVKFFPKPGSWRKWAIWLVVEFIEQSANLVIFSNSNQGKIFPARAAMTSR